MTQRFCNKCNRTFDEGNFYTYKNGEKCNQCKKCQTMHIDNYSPETFLWLLREMDVPYIEHEWNILRDRAAQKSAETHKPMTGMSVYGKYLSKMKLNQWNGYSWEDTERLAAEAEMKKQAAAAENPAAITSEYILKEMLEKGEIGEAEYKTLSLEADAVAPPAGQMYPTNSPYEKVDIIDIAGDLTEEDKQYLAMKWGILYRPDQWVTLEKFYTEMTNSFDIQGAAREDTLKKICKTSLKMEEAIDCGDTDNFLKLTRVYDTLMKSGKFSEAQNKEDGKGFINSVGELVALCEKEGGFIPRLEIEFPQDIVDKTLQDMNRYTFNLVTKDLGLAQQIEDQLKKIEQQREMEEEEEDIFASIGNEEDSLEALERVVLDDIAHQEFYDQIEEERAFDLAAQYEGGEEDVS